MDYDDSEEFSNLLRNIERLQNSLMPNRIDSTGNYSGSEYDRVNGFILLVHAEIEEFIEKRCRGLAIYSVDNYLNNTIFSPVVISILSVCSLEDEVAGVIRPKKSKNKIDVRQRVQSSLDRYISWVNSNNGINEKSLTNILVPLGFQIEDYQSQVSSINSFSSKRGSLAHKTSVGVKTLNDPYDIMSQLNDQIIPFMRELDKQISERYIPCAKSGVERGNWYSFTAAIKKFIRALGFRINQIR